MDFLNRYIFLKILKGAPVLLSTSKGLKCYKIVVAGQQGGNHAEKAKTIFLLKYTVYKLMDLNKKEKRRKMKCKRCYSAN